MLAAIKAGSKNQRMRYQILFGLLALATIFMQCKTKQVPNDDAVDSSVEMSNGFSTVFLDSSAAALGISSDIKDHFFDRVTRTEMSIQMKKVLDCGERAECVSSYQDFLMKDVEDFSSEEVSKVSAVFEEVNELISKVNPKLVDRDIILIKTKGNHYGPGTYYTRENRIIIPKDVLKDFNKEAFMSTMLHEFFHIFSRYNVATRDKLYALIGFKPVIGELELGSKGSRKLLNPDGTTDYFIDLEEHGPAYPLISATEDNFVEAKPTFFSYLDFHLYNVEEGEDGISFVKEKIDFQNAPSFFKQIKDNTNYIIHPDEIMADNFIYTIMMLAADQKIKDFSPEGMKLIDDIGMLLIAHE